MDIQTQILDYTVSLDYDRRLYHHDIRGSIAHARMLCRQGIISDDDAKLICEGLGVIEREIDEDRFPWDVSLEDIHMNIASRLTENIGAAGVVNDDGLSCVSIVGSGMQNSPGYASHMFRILADGEVNIDMITTSEIRISCIIKEEQVLDAVRLLHTGFGLDQDG